MRMQPINSKPMCKHLLLLLVLVFSSQAKINVVATTPDLGSIAKAIGGTEIDLTVLCKPTEDPHFVDPRPSYLVKLNRADVLIEGGAELESGYLPTLLQGARNKKILPGGAGYCSCAEGVSLLEIPTELDRSKGDIHARGNPHYLSDPANAIIVADHIAAIFCKVDPQNCQVYKTNAEKFDKALAAKIEEWSAALKPFAGKSFASYHNSWPYFAKRFHLKIDTFLEPKPGIPPTPGHLASVIQKMKREKVVVIFVEPFVNRKTAETVARGTGAKLVDVSHFPGGVKGTEEGYLQLLDYVVKQTAAAFSTAGP